MSVMWAILIIILIGIIAAVFFINKNKSATDADVTSDDISSTEQPEPLEDLVLLNLKVRKAGIDPGLTQQCEAVIDQLVNLIPSVNAAATPGSELTWTVNRIATEYLPNKCVMPYLTLSKDAQQSEQNITMMQNSLASLSKELTDVEALLASKDDREFNAKATFLKHRFNNNENGEA